MPSISERSSWPTWLLITLAFLGIKHRNLERYGRPSPNPASLCASSILSEVPNIVKVISMSHPLDNPVWHALTGPHAHHAIGGGLARHYPRDMAPFSGIAAETPAAYGDLSTNLPPNTEARLFSLADEPAPVLQP